MKKGTHGFRGHLLIYCLRCRSSCSLAIWSKSKSRQTKTTGANQLRVVPYEWSACDSPSSSPPLSEPVHQPCADPRPEKDSLCNQSVAPFMTSELFKRGEPQKTPPERLFCTPEVDHCGGWGRFSHQAAASQDYLSDFQSQINWAQLLGKAKIPRMQRCQHNLSVPVERWGIFSCVWRAGRDDASVWSIEVKC